MTPAGVSKHTDGADDAQNNWNTTHARGGQHANKTRTFATSSLELFRYPEVFCSGQPLLESPRLGRARSPASGDYALGLAAVGQPGRPLYDETTFRHALRKKKARIHTLATD